MCGWSDVYCWCEGGDECEFYEECVFVVVGYDDYCVCVVDWGWWCVGVLGCLAASASSSSNEYSWMWWWYGDCLFVKYVVINVKLMLLGDLCVYGVVLSGGVWVKTRLALVSSKLNELFIVVWVLLCSWVVMLLVLMIGICKFGLIVLYLNVGGMFLVWRVMTVYAVSMAFAASSKCSVAFFVDVVSMCLDLIVFVLKIVLSVMVFVVLFKGVFVVCVLMYLMLSGSSTSAFRMAVRIARVAFLLFGFVCVMWCVFFDVL